MKFTRHSYVINVKIKSKKYISHSIVSQNSMEEQHKITAEAQLSTLRFGDWDNLSKLILKEAHSNPYGKKNRHYRPTFDQEALRAVQHWKQ